MDIQIQLRNSLTQKDITLIAVQAMLEISLIFFHGE